MHGGLDTDTLEERKQILSANAHSASRLVGGEFAARDQTFNRLRVQTEDFRGPRFGNEQVASSFLLW